MPVEAGAGVLGMEGDAGQEQGREGPHYVACPAKRSHLHPETPPRKCLNCQRFQYAVHLTDAEWIAPKIKGSECPNYIGRESELF
jgi:hypothetical protein